MQLGTSSRLTSFKIILAFACVYFFWGSAFVAIRYSVQLVHPAFVAGIRYLIAGSVLLGFLFIKGYSLRLARKDVWKVAGLGLLMFSCNTVLLSYGGKELPAGMVALIIATIPLFIALLESFVPGGAVPGLWCWVGIVTGFLGIFLLLRHSIQGGLLSQSATSAIWSLVGAAFAWGFGSILLNRTTFASRSLVCTCWQMLIGGTADVLLGLASGGYQTSQWTQGAWLSTFYLAIFGTLVGYTSYSFLLQNVSISSVATYAYVNPLVAVFLGWLFLGEPLTATQWLGLIVVLTSVAIVTVQSRVRRVAGERGF
jgi:drug/metabolite transporter (DMT)-like permease